MGDAERQIRELLDAAKLTRDKLGHAITAAEKSLVRRRKHFEEASREVIDLEAALKAVQGARNHLQVVKQ